MTQSNSNKFEQQKSDAEVSGLKNQVENNLGSTDNTNEEVAEGLAENVKNTNDTNPE